MYTHNCIYIYIYCLHKYVAIINVYSYTRAPRRSRGPSYKNKKKKNKNSTTNNNNN